MNPNKTSLGIPRNALIVFIFVVVSFIASCSVQKHHDTLSFFFDGVPNPNDEKQTSAIELLESDSGDITVLDAQLQIPELHIHQPYLDKECTACHNKGQMGSLNPSQFDLCYQCHNPSQTTQHFYHGPVAAGFCSECHHPHKTENENLLHRPGNDLCYNCHSKADVSKNTFHNILKENTCISCHEAHGSENHTLLHQETCYLCHDNYGILYAYTHGPVSIGQCSECHSTHRKKSESLLVKNGQDLCFHCHDSRRILEDDIHSYIDNTLCTECHNPHGGEDRFMFK